MEDDNSEEDEEVQMFSVELTASELYSLNTILRYNIIHLDDPVYCEASQALAKLVHDEIASEEFEDAMQAQIDSAIQQLPQEPLGSGSMQRGVQ